MNASSGRLLSLVLVTLQGLIFLAVAASALLDGPAIPGSWWVGVPVVVLGGAAMVWGARDLGRALTPMPTPNGAGLAAGGAYRYVRHPMYAAIIVMGIGAAVGSGHAWTYAFTAVMIAFFDAKTRVEEAFLIRTYPGYADYASRTGKFVPGLGRRHAAM